MPKLNKADLERLQRSDSRLKWALLATVVAIIGLTALLIIADVGFVIIGGAGIGVLIGSLITRPHRRLLRELGITTDEAKAILTAEKEKRNGVAEQPSAERARKLTVRANIFLAIGLVALVALVVAIVVFAQVAGKTTDEAEGLDPAVPWSFIGGFASFVLAPSFLVAAKQVRAEARRWRAKS